jgi:hypothetical protein
VDEETREIHKLEMKILDVEQTVLIKVSALEIAVTSLNATVQQLVRKETFQPVAYIAYGLAAGVMTSALGAIMGMVFIK